MGSEGEKGFREGRFLEGSFQKARFEDRISTFGEYDPLGVSPPSPPNFSSQEGLTKPKLLANTSKELSRAHALLKGVIITDSQKNTRDNSKTTNTQFNEENPIECQNFSRTLPKNLAGAHALLKGAIPTDSQKNTRDNSKTKNILQWRKSHSSESLYLWDFPLEWCLSKGISSSYLWDFLLWIMGSSWNEYRRWAHLTKNLLDSLRSVPSSHKWWLAYLALWGPDLDIKWPLPLPFLFLQTGIRITTTFTCGWVRVSVQFHYYQLNSPERRSTNYFTFTFACVISQELEMQSCVAAW